MHKRTKSFLRYISSVTVIASSMFFLFYSYALSASTSTVVTLGYPSFASSTSPNDFVTKAYTYALSIAGTLAVVMIIYGGIKYVANPGNTSQLEDALDIIKSAVIGILILGGAYLILNTINPNIVKLQNFNNIVKPIPTETHTTSTTTMNITNLYPATTSSLPYGCSVYPSASASVKYYKCIKNINIGEHNPTPTGCVPYTTLSGYKIVQCTIYYKYKKEGGKYVSTTTPAITPTATSTTPTISPTSL